MIAPPTISPQARPAVADPTLTRPDWTQGGRDVGAALALDKNENTDAELHDLIASLAAEIPVSFMTQYPDCAPVYRALAAHLGLDAKNLLLAAGSDGAIRAVFEAYVSDGDTVMRTQPTFAMYPVYIGMFGGRGVALDYSPSANGPVLSVDTIIAEIRRVRPRLLCLPNPDSPTGTLAREEDIKRIVAEASASNTMVLIDEAYYPFSGVSAIGLIGEWRNLVVVRTFAKAWGLAGLRIGYAAAHPETTVMLHKVRPMYEVNGFALAMVAKLIEQADVVRESVIRIREGGEYFGQRMRQLGFKTLMGGGNFMHVNFGVHGNKIHAALKDKVLYRADFSEPCLAGFSRFTTAPAPVMARVAALIETALA